jgi:predicted component of type VI protein secretion system
MPYLEVRTPQGNKRLKLNDAAISVGRLPDNTLVLRDEKASRHHCVIEPYNGGFRLRDLGSRNGTRLNDQKVATEILDNGDIVRIGQSELHFIDPEQQAPRRKRRETPDFAAAHDDGPDILDQATLDIDLNEEVGDVQTGYERKLREIIDAAYDSANQILTDHRDKLEEIAMLLMERETIEGPEMEALFSEPKPQPDASGPTIPRGSAADDASQPGEKDTGGEEGAAGSSGAPGLRPQPAS